MSQASTVTHVDDDNIPTCFERMRTLETRMRDYLAKIHPSVRPVRTSVLHATMMNECVRVASCSKWVADRVRIICDLSFADIQKILLFYTDFPLLRDYLVSLL